MNIYSRIRYEVKCNDCEMLPGTICHSKGLAERTAEDHLKLYANPGGADHTVEITEKMYVSLRRY